MLQASADRVAFYIGNYPVMKYGITMGTAIAVSVFLLTKIREKYFPEFQEDKIIDLTFYIIIAGIIGARLWYVILNFGFYSSNISEIFMINHGGISIQGAILGGIAAGLIYAKKQKLKFLKLADMYILVVPIGQAIGRFGNFFNSEAFGKPCDLPWKMYISPQYRPDGFMDFEFFHPTFLYESILNICIFFILFFVFKKKIFKNDGNIFFLYLILYSVIRFFIEFIRIDSVLDICGIPVAAIISVLFAAVGLTGIFILSRGKQ